MEYFQLAITTLTLIAAILAWLAKLKWANEFKEAKEAQIQAIERELQTYKDLTPMKVQEYLKSTKEMLEEYNNKLSQELEIAQGEIGKKDEHIKQLGTQQRQEKEKFLSEKQELKKRVTYLERELNRVRPAYEQAAMISGSYNNFADSYLAFNETDEYTAKLIDFKDVPKFVVVNSDEHIKLFSKDSTNLAQKENDKTKKAGQ